MKKKYRNFELYSKQSYIDIEDIVNKIEANDSIVHYLYILHDKDTYTADDEKRDDAHKEGSLKDAHYHIFIKANNAYTFNTVANWFSIESQFVNKIEGKWGDVLLYATHKNAPDKYQYSDDEVVSDYDWTHERDLYKEVKSDRAKRDEIIQKIDEGTIRRYNYHKFMDINLYVKYKKDFDSAFKYYDDKIKNSHRTKECIFITGESGTGKTTYAKEYCESKGLTYYISSASNDIMNDYCGQDAIILDDVRPDCFGSLSDFLKMLDNNTSSSVKSRYNNKILECSVIIITTVLDIETFFSRFHDASFEPIKQLKRRCKTYLTLKEKDIDVKLYNEETSSYILVDTIENPIAHIYKREKLTPDVVRERVSSLRIDAFSKNTTN